MAHMRYFDNWLDKETPMLSWRLWLDAKELAGMHGHHGQSMQLRAPKKKSAGCELRPETSLMHGARLLMGWRVQIRHRLGFALRIAQTVFHAPVAHQVTQVANAHVSGFMHSDQQ